MEGANSRSTAGARAFWTLTTHSRAPVWGGGGLALIGQGEVSGVLMADPATLLGYVAEAAGVAKLSGRRDGAAARLGAARDHLARLEDILNELRVGVARLEAEAGEAARAASLGREVLQLRYTLSVRRVEALEAEIGSLREKAAEGRAAVAAGRDALSSAQEKWREARRVLGEREEIYRRAVGELEARRGDLRVAQERLKGTQARAEALRREAAGLAEETAALEAAPPAHAPRGRWRGARGRSDPRGRGRRCGGARRWGRRENARRADPPF